MIHISQQAELHLMKLKGLCVGAELSQGLSAKPAVPAIAFLCRAALLTVLVGQMDLLSGGKFSLPVGARKISMSVCSFSKDIAEILLLVPMGYVR